MPPIPRWSATPTRDNPRAGRALQREQDEFIARRNAAFGRPDYDLQKAMRERLDHLLAVQRIRRIGAGRFSALICAPVFRDGN